MNTILLYTSLFLTLGIASVTATPQFKEVNHSVRQTAAGDKLRGQSSTVSVFVKGFVCESCGIGLRKKIGKLKFVDRKRFNRGIDFDARHQLVTLAIKPGHRADPAAIKKAADDAGYVAVHLFSMQGSKLKVSSIK